MKSVLQHFSRLQILLEVLLLAGVGLLAGHYFARTEALQITAALAVAYALPRLLYTSRSWSCTGGRVVMLCLGALMTLMAVVALGDCTVVHERTLSRPYLASDDGTYFYWALSHYDTSLPPNHIAFIGFPLAMLALWKVLGVSVLWPMAMNVCCTLTAVVVTGSLARRLLKGKVEASDAHIAAAAMLMNAVLMYFLSQGLRIQKEAMVYVSFTVIGYVLAGMNTDGNRVGWRDLTLWLVACLVLGFTRTTYLYFVAIGLLMLAVAHWRGRVKGIVVMTVMLAVAFFIGNHWANYSIDRHLLIVEGGEAMQQQFIVGPSQQPYLEMVGKYFHYPVLKRLVLLPLTCAVQFVIPFPWLYNTPTAMELMPRLAWGWYAVGGMAMFYFLMEGFRRKGQALGVWAWWPVVVYVVIAYVVAGSVNRYILPLQPLAVPMALLVYYRLRQGQWRKAFTWWATIYCVVLIVTLIVCYHIQKDYLDSLNEYYQSLV